MNGKFKYLVIVSLLLLAGMGCKHSSTAAAAAGPLINWQYEYDYRDFTLQQDYQNYIKKLSLPRGDIVQSVSIYENGKGQHAVQIQIEGNGKGWMDDLFYNKYDVRTSVIRYKSGSYSS